MIQQQFSCHFERVIIVYLLISFGSLLFILYLGTTIASYPTIIITGNKYDEPSLAGQRKFIVQDVNLIPLPVSTRQQNVNTGSTSNKKVQDGIHRKKGMDETFTVHDNLEPIPRPPLSKLVHGWNITGDVSWLIQFSIIGFPKSGTSTLMFHLRDHPEIQMFPHERCELSNNRQIILIEDMYRQFPTTTSVVYNNINNNNNKNIKSTTGSDVNHRFVRGIKCPIDLENRKLALHNYQQYFSKTDFIVGIRHPILWFESFYNFRIQNKFPMPPAEILIGRCRKGWNNVCTNRAQFHVFLSNLGKTNITTDSEEMKYVNVEMRKTVDPLPMMKRKVFLYDVSQLSDRDINRSLQLRNDLQHFLHLKHPIAPFIWFRPGKNHTTTASSTGSDIPVPTINSNKIDICDVQYDKLRQILLSHSIQASRWIRKYFIHADGVVVSSKTYLENTILPTWEVDPCEERRSKTTGTSSTTTNAKIPY